ncbi:hypothetical protein [Solicola gregarius]|uniref:Abortive phage infection protein n=1 Tax=Solicola gregarius TaxID=2908642 RepID=A0AA46YLV4_9ACTN|nr:hypothetical protein [Solicola gregarius]UYM07350.1 hypothetical protein L0C25_09830 [Solicola gregarius]
MQTQGISRRGLLAGAAAVGATATAIGSGGPARARSIARGLQWRGVGYEITDGGYPATGWNANRMRHDIRAIRRDLHANSVTVFGDGVERLLATATEAAERGLRVWLQPRLADRPHSEILDHLAETARGAERLRREGASVNLSVGCEFVLFVPGIVPGDDVFERIENLQSGNFDPERMQRRLAAFIGRSAAMGRSTFHGPISYGAAEGEVVDWSLFDIVSVNYYAFHQHRSAYVRQLRRYGRWGKPVMISEFGSCTYRGAPKDGGMGWAIVDYDGTEETIKPGYVRSERTQARYVDELIGIFSELGLYGASVYSFAVPDAPHRPRRKYDLDIASYGLVKPRWGDRHRPTADWTWEPKEAFYAVARRYGREERRPDFGSNPSNR